MVCSLMRVGLVCGLLSVVLLALLWIGVRVVRHAWGEPPARALEPVTIHVRVERPEQVKPVVQSLLPALEGMRR